MKTSVVLYHASCFDGFGAALVARQALGTEDATYYPVSYGNPMPYVPAQSRVYILDFSYPAETLVELVSKKQCDVIMLDHHKSAEENLRQWVGFDNPFVRFDMNESGASLTWKHFHPEEPMPAMIRYIRDRDLWLWELDYSKEVSMALASYDFDFATWEGFLEASDDDYVRLMAADGAACLRLQQQMVKRMCAHAQLRPIGGYMVRVANATVFFSEVGEQLCIDYPDMPFAAYFSVRGDGKYQYGLRSRGGFDVSEIAKQYGGGGHAAAAGFVSDKFL